MNMSGDFMKDFGLAIQPGIAKDPIVLSAALNSYLSQKIPI